MATWIKCTRYGQPDGEVCVNLDMVVAIRREGNLTRITYGAGNGDNAGEVVVSESIDAILHGEPVRHA